MLFKINSIKNIWLRTIVYLLLIGLSFYILIFVLVFLLFKFIWNSKMPKPAKVGIIAILILPALFFGSVWTTALVSLNQPKPKSEILQSSSSTSLTNSIINSLVIPVSSSSISISSSSEISSVVQVPELPKVVQTAIQAFPAIQSEPAPQKVAEIVQDSQESGLLLDVQKIIDGDTVKVSQVGKLRLIGIDTPELKDPRKPVQCFATEASNKAKELLNGRKVYLAYNPAEKLDKYGRTLAYVFRDDGLDFNAEMIKLGYAQAYVKYPHPRLEEFVKYGQEAREKKVGLWSDSTCGGQVNQQYTESKKETIVAPLPIVAPIPKVESPKVVEKPVEVINFDKAIVIKTTSSGICHQRGTSGYNSTKTWTNYDSLDACLADKGKLPKK